MEALKLIDKWLYKHVSRNDLPIKDQNFTILCIEVIYSNETSPKCKNAGKLLSFPNGLCLYNGGTHTGQIMCITNEFFLTIKELLPIYHMTEKHQTTCIIFENFN